MDEERLGDKIVLNIAALTDLPPMHRKPTGIVRPPMFQLLQKRVGPFRLDGTRRCENKTTDTAHARSPHSVENCEKAGRCELNGRRHCILIGLGRHSFNKAPRLQIPGHHFPGRNHRPSTVFLMLVIRKWGFIQLAFPNMPFSADLSFHDRALKRGWLFRLVMEKIVYDLGGQGPGRNAIFVEANVSTWNHPWIEICQTLPIGFAEIAVKVYETVLIARQCRQRLVEIALDGYNDVFQTSCAKFSLK